MLTLAVVMVSPQRSALSATRGLGAYLVNHPSHWQLFFYFPVLVLVQTLALSLSSRKTLFEFFCQSRMNVSSLEVPPPQQVQRTSKEAPDKDADVRLFQSWLVSVALILLQFLSLRLLNKRARVRLSPEPLDLQPIPGKAQWFSVANSRGWFAAAIRNSGSDICTPPYSFKSLLF